MNDLVVIFRKDLPPQILHGQKAADYAGRSDVLINPVYPKDKQGHIIPPHQWFKVGNAIGATYQDHTQPSKNLSKLACFVAGCLSGILISVVLYLLRKP